MRGPPCDAVYRNRVLSTPGPATSIALDCAPVLEVDRRVRRGAGDRAGELALRDVALRVNGARLAEQPRRDLPADLVRPGVNGRDVPPEGGGVPRLERV